MESIITNLLKDVVLTFQNHKPYLPEKKNAEFLELCINRIDFLILEIKGENLIPSQFSWKFYNSPLQKAIDDLFNTLISGFFDFSPYDKIFLIEELGKIRIKISCFVYELKYETPKCFLVDGTENSINTTPKKRSFFKSFFGASSSSE